jgi:hypothetical protein
VYNTAKTGTEIKAWNLSLIIYGYVENQGGKINEILNSG